MAVVELDVVKSDHAVYSFECSDCGLVPVKSISLRPYVARIKETTMSKYQNRDVTVVRPARAGDAGFDAANTSEQVLIKDGNAQKAVLKSDVTE